MKSLIWTTLAFSSLFLAGCDATGSDGTPGSAGADGAMGSQGTPGPQ